MDLIQGCSSHSQLTSCWAPNMTSVFLSFYNSKKNEESARADCAMAPGDRYSRTHLMWSRLILSFV